MVRLHGSPGPGVLLGQAVLDVRHPTELLRKWLDILLYPLGRAGVVCNQKYFYFKS